MTVISYSDRISKIKTVSDLEDQVQFAKQYAQRIRNKAKKAGTLQEKIEISNKAKVAEKVLLDLRRNFFDIEDSISK